MIIRISISLFIAGSAPVRYKATFRLLRDKNSIEKIIVPKCNIYTWIIINIRKLQWIVDIQLSVNQRSNWN